MGYTIITTVSPDFERARRDFIPTWEANAGADEIVIHEINEGSWVGNIVKRAEILMGELLERLPRGEKVLALDADCIVLRDLSDGFSDDHIISVARWPNVNLGVVMFNLAVEFKWERWLADTLVGIQEEGSKPRKASHECDQVVWRPRMHAIEDRINKLAEWEWNYNTFDYGSFHHELPKLVDLCRIVHFKGHGDWEWAECDRKMRLLKQLWPKEMACIESA
jgi:hypothetical protein